MAAGAGVARGSVSSSAAQATLAQTTALYAGGGPAVLEGMITFLACLFCFVCLFSLSLCLFVCLTCALPSALVGHNMCYYSRPNLNRADCQYESLARQDVRGRAG